MSVKVRWVKPVPSVWQKVPDIPLQSSDLIPNWVRYIVVGTCVG